MKSGELIRGDLELLRDHGVVVKATVAEARSLFDQVEDGTLGSAIDEAQGAVFSGKAGRAYLIIVIDPDEAGQSAEFKRAAI